MRMLNPSNLVVACGFVGMQEEKLSLVWRSLRFNAIVNFGRISMANHAKWENRLNLLVYKLTPAYIKEKHDKGLYFK